MKEKNILISVLQTFGILLVVLGHCCSGLVEKPIWYHWIYAFHMPLFVFISGFLLRYSGQHRKLPLREQHWSGKNGFVWSKVRRLLVPYVVISTVAFLPKALLSEFALRPVEFSWMSYAEMLAFPMQNVIGFFWFLPMLFVIFMMVLAVSKLLGQNRCRLLHPLLLLLALAIHLIQPLQWVESDVFGLLNFAGALDYLFYFALGYYVCRFDVLKYIGRHALVEGVLTFVFSILLLMVLPNFWGKDVLAAVNGIYMSICWCRIYVESGTHFLTHLFGASYAIFLFSWFPQTASQQVFLSLTGAPVWVGSLLAFVTGVYVPWVIYRWVMNRQHSRWGQRIAFLMGHR